MSALPPSAAQPGASGLTRAAWLRRLSDIGRDHGFFDRVGQDHLALFVQEGDTLVVSFDRANRVFTEEADGMPRGFEAVIRREWSLLSILSTRDSWFRAPDLMAFFDALSASGFFDSFAQVIFLGFGPAAGHAACAYASAAPGALVLASSPAATLDPELAGFDHRFRPDRARDFSRYGDAPSLVETARQAVILYDPTEDASAAHAGQFRAASVTLVPLRFSGPAPHALIASGGLLMLILRALVNNRLTRTRLVQMTRATRRADPAYLWRLAHRAEAEGHPARARLVAAYAAEITGEPRFTDLAARLAS
jgi:hypothetical protein